MPYMDVRAVHQNVNFSAGVIIVTLRTATQYVHVITVIIKGVQPKVLETLSERWNDKSNCYNQSFHYIFANHKYVPKFELCNTTIISYNQNYHPLKTILSQNYHPLGKVGNPMNCCPRFRQQFIGSSTAPPG